MSRGFENFRAPSLFFRLIGGHFGPFGFVFPGGDSVSLAEEPNKAGNIGKSSLVNPLTVKKFGDIIK